MMGGLDRNQQSSRSRASIAAGQRGFSTSPHSDTAAGAKLAIVTTQLRAKAHPKIVERVSSITTPGETIDAVVTEAGIAV
jgi:citrate lyase subunit alpha/citrate CoA-transferase